jgi:hypothetical protein
MGKWSIVPQADIQSEIEYHLYKIFGKLCSLKQEEWVPIHPYVCSLILILLSFISKS